MCNSYALFNDLDSRYLHLEQISIYTCLLLFMIATNTQLQQVNYKDL